MTKTKKPTRLNEIDSPDHDVTEDDILYLIDLARAGETLSRVYSCMCSMVDGRKCPGCEFESILKGK